MAALLLLGLLAGCAGPGGFSAPVRRTLVVGVLSLPGSLNPLYATGRTATDLESLIFSPLYRVGKGLEPRPVLAASPPRISPGGRTYTVPLRTGVRWQDGQPLTAQDVVFTLQAMRAARNASPLEADFRYVRSVSAVGDSVRIRLTRPWAPFLLDALTDVPILPAHLLGHLSGQALADSPFGRHPVGTGPYRVVRWVGGTRLELAANPRYFGRRPNIPRVVFRAEGSARGEVAALRAGAVDLIAGLAPQELSAVHAVPGVRVRAFSRAAYAYLGFPLGTGSPFDPVAVRRAFYHAIDRRAIVDGVLAGQGTVADSPVSPAQAPFYAPGRAPGYDPARAAILLRAAGWRRGPGGIRYRKGKPFRFDLLVPGGGTTRLEAARLAARDLAAVGLAARVRQIAWSAFLRDLQAGSIPGVWLAEWTLPPDPDPSLYLDSRAVSPYGMNVGRYADPTVDRAISAEEASLQLKTRQQAFRTLEQAVLTDPPYVFLYYPRELVAYRGVTGVRGTPFLLDYYRLDRWRLVG